MDMDLFYADHYSEYVAAFDFTSIATGGDPLCSEIEIATKAVMAILPVK